MAARATAAAEEKKKKDARNKELQAALTGKEKDTHNKQVQAAILGGAKSTLPPNPLKGKALVNKNVKAVSGALKPGSSSETKKSSKENGSFAQQPFKIVMLEDQAHPLDTLRAIKFGDIPVPEGAKEKVKRVKTVTVPPLTVAPSQITAGSSGMAKQLEKRAVVGGNNL